MSRTAWIPVVQSVGALTQNQVVAQIEPTGFGEDGVPVLTAYGIECLEQLIADERAAGRAPPKAKSTK